jgi:hypothetical protein
MAERGNRITGIDNLNDLDIIELCFIHPETAASCS